MKNSRKVLEVGILVSLLAGVVSLLSTAPERYELNPMPDVNISAIRHLSCEEGDGSGFLIAKNMVVTAKHVAEAGRCIDKATGAILKTYYKEADTDFALMTGDLPEMPYIKYSCAGFSPGSAESYGISSYGFAEDFPIIRQNILTVGPVVTAKNDDGTYTPNYRRLFGYIVPGTSGGPIIQGGYARGLNNTVRRHYGLFGIEYIVPVVHSAELKNTILCKTTAPAS